MRRVIRYFRVMFHRKIIQWSIVSTYDFDRFTAECEARMHEGMEPDGPIQVTMVNLLPLYTLAFYGYDDYYPARRDELMKAKATGEQK